MMWVVWNLILVYLETVLVLAQDRCMVYVKHTMGSEIIFDRANGTSGDEDQVEAWFGLFVDSASLDVI
jgi:hypothetical protein